jgi:membrane-associated phospholipid phosphatase
MDLLAGWAGGHQHWPGWLFGAAMIAITIAPPYAYVLYGVHRGRLTDRHLGDRRQRAIPLLLGTAAAATGIAILGLAGAPRLLLAATATTGAGLLAAAAVSRFWKMSGHTAAAAAVLVICAGIFHGWPLLAAPVVALIGWARVRLKDHTAAQVVAGGAFGAAIALVAMPPLAGW